MFLRTALYIVIFLASLAVFLKFRSPRVRQAVLLAGSFILYASWGLWFAAVLLASTVMNFAMGRWVRQKSSRMALPIAILLNLLLLSCFKYFPEISIRMPFSSLQRFSHLALPLGLSFWTFQAMSYLFDSHYRGEELDPSFCEFALYMVFFPITIAGPICRMPQMLPQFRSGKPTSWGEIGNGLSRIATGALMMQLAKLLGQGILAGDGINSGFDHVSRWTGPDVWCLAFGYGLQLFFDFAGYSHIAIGAGKALGFTLPENFARPFGSTTPSVFWTRWHMSLSFWIRDYVFLPFAMLGRELWWQNLGLVLSMVLFGIWHKATLLFVLWGLYHGVLLVLHRQIQELQHRLEWAPAEVVWTPISRIATMCLVSIGWILFRANSLTQARQMLSSAGSPGSYGSHFLSGSLYLLVAGLAAGYAMVLLVSDTLARYSGVPERTRADSPRALTVIARWRWFWLPPIYVLTLLFVSVVTASQGGNAAQLMYRRF